MTITSNRLIAIAAGLLLAACSSTHTTSSTVTTTPGSSYSSTSNGTTSTSTTVSTNTTPTTTTDQNGVTTTTLTNGSTVTRTETTTVAYPNGTVKTLNGADSATAAAGTTASGAPALPPGSTLMTRTVTTVTLPPQPTAAQSVVYVPQPAPMASSTTIYPAPTYLRGRRFPGLDFLVFADRASFSGTNSLNGTLTTGAIRSDIRHENGFGLGLNAFMGNHMSLEFTASRVKPTATFTPTNAGVNPITGLRIRMTPVTGTLQAHFNPWSTVDLYLGGGAAYVFFKPDRSFNAGNTGITNVSFKDEWGPLANAGLGFNVSRNFGINFDAKYMWIRARTTTTFNEPIVGNVGNSERFGLNPLVLSAGIRFGF